jgi:hypothetical protein
MASTYSTNLKIELIGTGEQAGTWGTTTNSNLGTALEQAIVGKADVTMSGTTTLSLTDSNAAQDARALYLNLSGTLSGAADLVVPALQKSYLVKNGTTGGYAVTIKVTGQTGVSIPNGKTVWVYNNGTDVVTAVDHIPSLTLGAALPIASGGTGSTSTTFVNLATNVTGTLPVANGGTGITSFGTGVATFLGTPSSANLAAAVTDETGTGALVFANTPTLESPVLGTPTSGALTTCTADGTNPVGFKNIPKSGSAKTTAYELATGDVGKFIEVGASGSITIPDDVFAAGDVVSIFNNTTGDITITCTIAEAYIAGVNTDETGEDVDLATRGICTILFISGTLCVISGNVS